MNASQQTAPSARSRGGIFYGWYIVAASIATNIYLSVSFFQGFQVFFLPILNEFGWSRTLMSGAFSLRQLESGFLAPAAGFAVDKWGPRKVIFIGVLIGGLGLASISLVQAAWMFYLAFLVTAVGVSGASHGIAWTAAVTNWFRRLRGRALGIAYLGPVVGGPLVIMVALLEEAVGWRSALVILGVGLWVVGLPLALVARRRPEDYGMLPDGDDRRGVTAEQLDAARMRMEASETPSITAGAAVRTPAFWLLSGIFTIHGFGVNGIMVHMIPLFQSIGFSSREAAAVVGLTFFLSGIGRLSAGVLMDRFAARWVVVAIVVLQTVSFLILSVTGTHWWQVFLFCLTYGVPFGGSIPTRPLMIREMFGYQSFSAINGLAQGISIASGMVGPLVMGIVFDLTGTYTPALLLFVFTTIAVLPLVFALRPVVTNPERLGTQALL